MTRVRLLSIGALVVVVFAALALVWQKSSREDAAERARTNAELQALRAESERLREAVGALQVAPPAKQGKAAPRAEVTPELIARVKAAVTTQGSTAPAPAPMLTPEQEREELLRYGSWLEDRVLHSPEARDATAATLKGKVSALLGEDSALLELKCSQELCRMNTRHDDLEAYRQFQGRAFQDYEKRVWSGPTTFVVVEEPDGHGSPLMAAIYMGRGPALPSPEPAL